MLLSIHIENYALIRQTDIELAEGMTAITGETGAGKSILLGALGLLLGQRADCGVLYDKERKCVVEASFSIEGLHLERFFASNDLDYEPSLIIRREILPSAKSRAFVNDTPVSLTVLKELGARLIDIHSQHETLTLAESDFQIGLLDSFNGGRDVRRKYDSAFATYQQHKQHLEQLMAADAQNRKEHDYMQFLFDELQQMNLRDGEQEELEQESQLLAHAEGIKQAVVTALGLCNGNGGEEEDCAVTRLNASKTQLAHIASFHPDAEALYQRFESNLIDLQDILSEMEAFNDHVQFSPERQQTVDERLDAIYRLEKKHNVDSIAQLLQIRDDLDGRLQAIAGMDEEIRHAMEAVDKAFGEVQRIGARLSEIRLKSAHQIEQQVLPGLAALGMKEARLKVQVEPTADYRANGADRVQFLFNANRGGELREMGKVISGGELSRLMLVLKSLTVKEALLPTIIFDEIDTGISGEVSAKMAHIISQMAQGMQVVAITHLPQMAAAARRQFKVYKEVEDNATVSRIRELQPDERVHEIAVMLSADPPTEAALLTAREQLGAMGGMK